MNANLTAHPPQGGATGSPMISWALLLAASILIAAALHQLHLPAAFLLGPMAAAVMMATGGRALGIPAPAFSIAQGIVGVMIGSTLPGSIFHEILSRWPVFLLGTTSTLVAAYFLGWMLARSRVLPGTTGIWGSAPGAATAMTLMSESYGADLRLVAFMQYLRVACCAIIAAVIARLLGIPASAHAAHLTQDTPWQGALIGLSVVLAGSFLGWRLRIPAGGLLLSMAGAMAIKLTAIAPIALSPVILVLGYALIGWTIGMRFTRDVLVHAGRAFPRVLLSILALIAICGASAGALVLFAGVDPLTAYLATSPGGADSVSIIAAETRVDVPFVIAMQVARFVCVLAFGPALAGAVSRLISKDMHP